MISLLTTKHFSRQALIACVLCITGCAPIMETHKKTDSEYLIPLDIVNCLLMPYSEKEMQLIHSDLKNIKEVCLRDKTPNATPMYIATAGGPGARKSTILEIYLHHRPNCVYADPDQRALKYMINTYHQSLTCYENSTHATYNDLQKNAYTKWRSASNYIANSIINEAFAKGYDIAHGTTSTTSTLEPLYKKLKQKNYKILLLLCYAPDETRIKANEDRTNVQGFVQVTQEDLVNKGKLFHQRFPTYFEYADKIYLYWTQDFSKGSIHAATYERGKKLVINNKEALLNFVAKYDEDRKNSQLPSFDELINKQLTHKSS